ncbi:MAG: DUF5684 domain-containing protein [Rikenellaceae bacterium]|nr:DUF5684 domain-containing protein [Rikenellaceae bacterium]
MYNSNYSSFFVVYYIVWSIVMVILLVSNWKIFEKAGEKGWKALIPVYNNYILVKISGRPIYYFWIIFASYVMICVPFFTYTINAMNTLQYGGPANPGISMLMSLLILVFSIVCIVYIVLVFLSLCDRFGVSRWFTLGILLLPVIFLPILAFGNYRYTPLLASEDKNYLDISE